MSDYLPLAELTDRLVEQIMDLPTLTHWTTKRDINMRCAECKRPFEAGDLIASLTYACGQAATHTHRGTCPSGSRVRYAKPN